MTRRVRFGRWWADRMELRWRLRDARCAVLGHRIEVVVVSGGDRVAVCTRNCGHYRYLPPSEGEVFG